jgi:hypothetical protein
MATKYYSSLYHNPPNPEVSGGAPIYQGPHGAMTAGSSHFIRGTVTIPAATFTTGDTMALCKVPKDARLVRIAIVPSADLDSGNSFTFNLGWTSASNTHASASTGLQGTAAFELKASDTIAAAVSIKGDELVLARAAGALAAGTLSFVAELSYD